MWPNPQETADLATFTEGILNGKLYFLSSERGFLDPYTQIPISYYLPLERKPIRMVISYFFIVFITIITMFRFYQSEEIYFCFFWWLTHLISYILTY